MPGFKHNNNNNKNNNGKEFRKACTEIKQNMKFHIKTYTFNTDVTCCNKKEHNLILISTIIAVEDGRHVRDTGTHLLSLWLVHFRVSKNSSVPIHAKRAET